MRVLITNNSLAFRAGTELYVRDLAIELMRRGHSPVAYSTKLGCVAEDLRSATVPVINRLDQLGESPDIIHGHHHYETITALLRFPETPAIYFCHGWLPWEEAPLRHPSILRYVAVDELCRERLIAEGGIDPHRITTVFNFFDRRIFAPRPPLPKKPRRALAFANEFSENSGLPILREACSLHGIQLDSRGLSGGNVETHPGKLLPHYDLVFAKARSAIEAMAVGAAVILCAPGRLGPMVSMRNLESLRAMNFGIRVLSQPLSLEGVLREIANYDSEDAEEVAGAIRAGSELQSAVDRILAIYNEVRAGLSTVPNDTSAAQSAARYLEDWAVPYKGAAARIDELSKRADAAECSAAMRDCQFEEMSARLTQREQTLADLQREHFQVLEEVSRERNEFERQIAQMNNSLNKLNEDLAAAAAQLEQIRTSASWRWTQAILRSVPVQILLGGAIRAVARRHQVSTIKRPAADC